MRKNQDKMDGVVPVAGHDGGEDPSALMGSTTAIYSYKNSHSYMMKSHDWLTQTHSTVPEVIDLTSKRQLGMSLGVLSLTWDHQTSPR